MRTLVHQEAAPLQEDAVCGDAVAGLRAHHVPRDEPAGGKALKPSVPKDPDGRLGQGLEALQGLLGALLLEGTEEGVEEQDGQDDQGLQGNAPRPLIKP